MVGGFIDKRDLDKAAEVVKDFMKAFGLQYTQSFANELIGDMLEANDDEKSTPRKLLRWKAKPPEKSGTIQTKSSFLGKWKDRHAVIQPDYSLAISEDEKAEKPLKTLNLWAYKPSAFVESKHPKRKGGPDWIPDEERSNCKSCEKEFSLFNRRHHCRLCGEIFCGDCCDDEVHMPVLGYDGEQRCCKNCFAQVKEIGMEHIVAIAVESDAKEAAASDADNFWGIKLLHETRQPQFFICPTKEDRDEWMKIFKLCCAKAKPPVNPNPLQAEAFKAAYMKSCWKHSIYKAWKITGTEGEMLGLVVGEVIRTKVLDEMFRKLKVPDSVRKSTEKAIKSQVNSTTMLLVDPAWEAISEAAGKSEQPLREKIEPHLAQIGEARGKMEAKISEKIAGVLEKALEKVAKPVLEKGLKDIVNPICDAYKHTYEAFKMVYDDLVQKASDPASLQKEIDYLHLVLAGGGHYMGSVDQAMREADKALKSLGKTVDAHGAKLNHTKVYQQLKEGMHGLVQDALHTLVSDVAVQGAQDGAALKAALEAAYKGVADNMFSDSKVAFKESLQDLFVSIIEPPVTKEVLDNKEVSGLTGELDSMIPEAIAQFISTADSLENVLTSALEDSIASALEKGTAGTDQILEQQYIMANK